MKKFVFSEIIAVVITVAISLSTGITALAADTQQITPGNTGATTVKATVESEAVVWLPTNITVSGTPDENKKYTGEGTVIVEGDIAGDQLVTVTPENSILLKQPGKDDIVAQVAQEKTVFTYDDIQNSNNAVTAISADTLSAGEWNSVLHYNVSINENPLSAAHTEYFTWSEDKDFTDAYEEGDLSDYPGLTTAEKNESSSYSYPGATAITGLTDEGVEWIKENGGRLIFPSFATSIADNTSNAAGAFGRFNSKYGTLLSKTIKYVDIPENISYIGYYAFAGLENLEYANINSSVIGERSFFNCDALKKVNLNNKTKIIGKNAFYMCIELENLYGASNVQNIETSAFYYCYKLKSIDDLSNCLSIGEKAFSCTYSLDKINLSDNIKSIGASAFEMSNCSEDFTQFTNCLFGDYATINQIYTKGIPEYTYTPCVNDISHFAQHDKRWSQTQIPGTNKYFGSSGCGWCCLATIYNYYNDTNLTPVDIANMVSEVNSSLIGDGSFRYSDNSIYEAAGLNLKAFVGGGMEVSDINKINDFQTLLNALSEGNIAILNYGTATGGSAHSILAYGVTESGEIMCADGSLAIHNNAVDPDYTTADSIRLQEPYYFTVRAERFLASWNNYVIVSEGSYK